MKNWEELKLNQTFWKPFKIRMEVIKAIREFFWAKNFLEVETPLLVPSLILESTINHFHSELITQNGLKKRMFLTSSPEASLKKLLVAGAGNIFEITKSFRNGEDGTENHNSEFTILEWYEINATYKESMKMCERLIIYISNNLVQQNSKFKIFNFKSNLNKQIQNDKIYYRNKDISLTPPWERISVKDVWEKYTGIPFSDLYDIRRKSYPLEKIIDASRKLGYQANKKNSWEEIFNQIFLNEIEPQLIKDKQPKFLYDYPAPLSALAKIKKSDERFAERFELYIGGMELADCYSELVDFNEQIKRFRREKEVIKKRGGKDFLEDQDYISALKQGLPKSSGVALGVDRLVMLFANSKSLDKVILFPNGET